MEFNFTIDIDRWQRDLRTKKFVLLRRFRNRLERFAKFIKMLSRAYAPVDTGTLRSAIKIKYDKIDETQGIYLWSVYVDKAVAPHWQFHEYGRDKGPAPPAKIREWVERKLGLSGSQAYFVTKAILSKLFNIGFNYNVAPTKFFEKAIAQFKVSYLKMLLYEIDLDVREVFHN